MQSIHDAVVAEFGDPTPGRSQPVSESPNEEVTIPDIFEATGNKEIVPTELIRFQRQGGEDILEV